MRKYLILAVAVGMVSTQEGKPPKLSEKDVEHMEYASPDATLFFESLLKGSVIHEFSTKVMVTRAGKECFYEDCDEGSELSCSFESSTSSYISKGEISAYLSFPNGSIAASTDKPEQSKELEIWCPTAGVYEFCLDNSADHISQKIIEFQISVMHHREGPEFHSEQRNETDNTIYVLFDRLFQVTNDIHKSNFFVKHTKLMTRRDYELLRDNETLVGLLSIAVVVLMITVSASQVIAIKRMFPTTVKPSI
uniref:GOLD domain-containing protein n=1 Tax=Ciona savignyi TaxID=51511 RepID=H2ZES9_CIOSA